MNEVTLSNGRVLDSYVPGREIVERKMRQYADLADPATLRADVDLMVRNYTPNVKRGEPEVRVSGGDRTRANFPDQANEPLTGELVLEIPPQARDLDPQILRYAERRGVTVRDVTGRIYTPKFPGGKASLMQHIVHGSRWNPKLRFMLDPVSEEQARSDYENGEPVVVAAAPEPLLCIDPDTYEGPDGEEPATWTLHVQVDRQQTPAVGFAHVTFYSLWGLEEAKYMFALQKDGRLFLGHVHEYKYADPTDSDSKWSRWRQLTFQPDGYSKEVVTDMRPDRSQDVQMTEYRGGDFSAHYEPVPEFGDWSELLRRQR